MNPDPEWLQRLVVSPDGKAHRIVAIGMMVQLDDGQHVPLGLLTNPAVHDWQVYELRPK